MLTALELQPCHKSLADAGFDFELPSGVKCLVSVEEFRACIASTEVEQLDRRHVVVSEELEDIVKQVIEDLTLNSSSRAIAAVKACERSQEPITFDTADHVVAVIVNAICQSILLFDFDCNRFCLICDRADFFV